MLRPEKQNHQECCSATKDHSSDLCCDSVNSPTKAKLTGAGGSTRSSRTASLLSASAYYVSISPYTLEV